jgi:hypothetical protein
MWTRIRCCAVLLLPLRFDTSSAVPARPGLSIPGQDLLDAAGSTQLTAAVGLVDGCARVLGLKPTCLRRSLAVQRILRWQGIPTQLQIGVLKHGDTLTAHAWLELDGRILNDHPANCRAFVRMMPMPLRGAPWRR